MTESLVPDVGAFTVQDKTAIDAVFNKMNIATGKVLTVDNSLEFAGTDSTKMTFPTTSATIARTDAANTFTGTQTVGALVATTVNGNTITTGTGVLTLAAAITATGPATSGTLALTAPPPQAGGSTIAVSAAMSGKPILLDTAGGTVATLPSATGTGNKYRFIVSTSTTSAAHKILAGADSAYIIGNAYGYTGSTAKVFGSAAATNHSIQMPNSGSQPSGGIIGDVFDFVDIGTALWHCIGFYSAGTTPTTPFSTATT